MPEVTKFLTRAEFINTISETITNCTRVHKMSFNFQKIYRFLRLKLYWNNATTRKCCIRNYWDYLFNFIKWKLFSMNITLSRYQIAISKIYSINNLLEHKPFSNCRHEKVVLILYAWVNEKFQRNNFVLEEDWNVKWYKATVFWLLSDLNQLIHHN